MIGSIPEAREMRGFRADHGIVADIGVIRAEQINDACERMLEGDVTYRFVTDCASLVT